jgi:NAD(P)-dependent dehydrogenase (short-subunit alcohol dehydrogenase family)
MSMTENTKPLRGRKALITGAAGGLGNAIARELTKQGCELFLTGRDAGRLQTTRGELADLNSQVHNHVADLSNTAEVEGLANRAVETMGAVDILINSAGVFPVCSLAESSSEDFDRCFAVNVRAPFVLMQRLATGMTERGWGRIVNIGSSSAYAGFRDTAIYCASKHALLGLSRSLFQELKGSGVRVYCLSPGSIQTEMGKQVRGQTFETFIRPEEVARYLVFMISFDAEMISEEVRLNRMIVQ